MNGLDIFTWIVFVVIALSVVVVLFSLAVLPGKIAKKRNHPQADAINIAGWLGLLLTMGVVWVLAMVWSFTVPANTAEGSETTELDSLRARIAELEDQLVTGVDA